MTKADNEKNPAIQVGLPSSIQSTSSFIAQASVCSCLEIGTLYLTFISKVLFPMCGPEQFHPNLLLKKQLLVPGTMPLAGPVHLRDYFYHLLGI